MTKWTDFVLCLAWRPDPSRDLEHLQEAGLETLELQRILLLGCLAAVVALAKSVSPGGRSQGEESVAPGDEPMVELPEEHCRAPMQVQLVHVRVPAFCRKLTSDCGYAAHHHRRDAGEAAKPGVYSCLLTERGFGGHAQAGLSQFTPAKWEEQEARCRALGLRRLPK